MAVYSRVMLTVAAASALIVATASSGFAQQCTPVGPQCQAAQQRVQTMVERMNATNNSAEEKGYCVSTAQSEATLACASEFSAAGRSSCAEAATAQANQYAIASRGYSQKLATVSSAARSSCGL